MKLDDRLPDPDVLIAQLRQEALIQSPQYSPSRHERIMQRLAREGAPTPIVAPITLRRRLRWEFVAAAAAMLAVLIWAGMWRASSGVGSVAIKLPVKSEPKPFSTSPVPPLPPLGTALASALEPAGEQLGEGRFGYLDQGAQSFTRFVADQFDVLPTSRQ